MDKNSQNYLTLFRISRSECQPVIKFKKMFVFGHLAFIKERISILFKLHKNHKLLIFNNLPHWHSIGKPKSICRYDGFKSN